MYVFVFIHEQEVSYVEWNKEGYAGEESRNPKSVRHGVAVCQILAKFNTIPTMYDDGGGVPEAKDGELYTCIYSGIEGAVLSLKSL